MTQQRPPTPPSGNAELQYGLHQLVQHNASTPYHYDVEDGTYLHSGQQTSSYSSPGPVMHDPYLAAHYGGSQYPDLLESNGIGLGIKHEGYGTPGPAYYHNDSYSRTSSPYLQSMQIASPPTPRSSTNSDGGRRTRSGRPGARSSSQQADNARVGKSPRPRKPKAGKGDKPKTPKLTAPLSVLTKDLTSVPVRDMEAWVNRPAEVRRQEVEKRNGYVTRPMNSFMLYRSAYAERTKQWCLQNNHQVVSSVSGESWPMEPPEVREQYNEYAKIERINHQNAHPTYKFSPSKSAGSGRKRKGAYSDDEDDDDEPTDVDDPDAEWGVSYRKSRARSSRRQGKEAGYPASVPLSRQLLQPAFGPNEGINKSAWEYTNEGKPLPAAIGHTDLYHQYYQTTVHPSMSAPGIEDVRLRRMEHPGMTYDAGHSLLGLPGGQHHDLMQLNSHTNTPMPQEPQVDPMLLAYDNSHFGHQGGNGGFEASSAMQFNDSFNPNGMDSYFGSVPGQEYRTDPWQVDPTGAPLETGSEFDKWMD